MAARKHPPVPVIVLVLLLLAGGGAWWWWTSAHPAEADATLRAGGSAESREYQVSPALAGRVAAVAVAEGDTVKAGDQLVTLDSRALELQLAQAEQGVAAAQAAVVNAKEDEDATDADVTAARARRSQAQAAVELARLQLEYTSVTAPRDGVVVSITTNVGQNAAPGRAVLTLVDPSEVFVRVFVPEARIGEVEVGQQVGITTDGSAGVPGTVTFIASSAEFTPNTVQTEEQRTTLVFEVRVRVDDPSGPVRAGMPADVAFG